MKVEYQKEKAFWQRYTDDDLTNDDIDEINHNLQEFAKVLLDIHKELKEMPDTGGKGKNDK